MQEKWISHKSTGPNTRKQTRVCKTRERWNGCSEGTEKFFNESKEKSYDADEKKILKCSVIKKFTEEVHNYEAR
jgi:hypothetical protein